MSLLSAILECQGAGVKFDYPRGGTTRTGTRCRDAVFRLPVRAVTAAIISHRRAKPPTATYACEDGGKGYIRYPGQRQASGSAAANVPATSPPSLVENGE